MVVEVAVVVCGAGVRGDGVGLVGPPRRGVIVTAEPPPPVVRGVWVVKGTPPKPPPK